MTAPFYRPSTAARAAVRVFAESHMTAAVRILRGELGQLDPTTGIVGGLRNQVTVYEGQARIKPVTPAGNSTGGGGETAVRDCEISMPMEAAMPRKDDLVVVTNDDTADSNLDGRVFRVLGVAGGSFFGDTRKLSCTGWTESRYWAPA